MTNDVKEQLAEVARSKAWGVYAECSGTIDEMVAYFEVREPTGTLIGSGSAWHLREGEEHGWDMDPWAAAHGAVRQALWWLGQRPRARDAPEDGRGLFASPCLPPSVNSVPLW